MTTKQLLIKISFISFFSACSLTTLAQSGIPKQPSNDTTKSKDSPMRVDDNDVVFEKAEVDASIDLNLWRKHLEANLPAYLEAAANNKMKAGQYTVMVRFIVEKDGSISNVAALNDVGYGLALGAMNVIKTAPKWKPAEQNGRKVRCYHTQPITFSIQEEIKNKKKGDR